MARMTGATETHASARSRDVQVRVSAALVTGAGRRAPGDGRYVDSISGAIIDLVEPVVGIEPALLAVGLMPWVPLARGAVLGPGAHLGVLAAPVALGDRDRSSTCVASCSSACWTPATGSAATDSSTGPPGLLTVTAPVGAALAWGIARRRGTRWWPGLLVAAVRRLAVPLARHRRVPRTATSLRARRDGLPRGPGRARRARLLVARRPGGTAMRLDPVDPRGRAAVRAGTPPDRGAGRLRRAARRHPAADRAGAGGRGGARGQHRRAGLPRARDRRRRGHRGPTRHVRQPKRRGGREHGRPPRGVRRGRASCRARRHRGQRLVGQHWARHPGGGRAHRDRARQPGRLSRP